MLQVLFGLPFWISVLLGSGVVVVYSTIGGMWLLTLTDIVQFVIKTGGLMFILLLICLYRVGGWDELVAKLPASSFMTLAYKLLVGGMLIPLIGAIFWKRATTSGAITSMTLGFVTVLVFMFKGGLDANTPIYYSLVVGLVSFVLVSVLSRRPEAAATRVA